MSQSDFTLNITSLISTQQLSRGEIKLILSHAASHLEINKREDKKNPILRGRTIINLFYENSTRTRTSFELAGKRMGADVINISAASSSASKGETLIDTAQTLNAMNPDAVILRHPESGATELLSKQVNCAVINAGDGQHAHPTQALLDAMTIQQHCGDIEGLTIAICGDILHSRVARSNLDLLTKLGAKVRFIAPPTLAPQSLRHLTDEIYHNMEEGLTDADVVMMLRVQSERMSSPFLATIREYFDRYGLDHKKLAYAKPHAIVMHPGPINRGLEISGELADDPTKHVILQQVENGLAVRQALLELLIT